MEIKINHNTFHIEPKKLEDVITLMYDYTILKGLNINYLIIDGLPVYNNYQKFLEDNIKVIENITVITQSIPKLISTTLESTEIYIGELVENLQEITQQKEVSHEVTSQIKENLISDIHLMLQTSKQINALISEKDTIRHYSGWVKYNKAINVLSKHMDLLEKYEYIDRDHLEDIINIFKELKSYVKYLINYMSLY